MSILPTFYAAQEPQGTTSESTGTIPREYGIDFTTGQLTGKIVGRKRSCKGMDMELPADAALSLSDLFLGLWCRYGTVYWPCGLKRIPADRLRE